MIHARPIWVLSAHSCKSLEVGPFALMTGVKAKGPISQKWPILLSTMMESGANCAGASGEHIELSLEECI